MSQNAKTKSLSVFLSTAKNPIGRPLLSGVRKINWVLRCAADDIDRCSGTRKRFVFRNALRRNAHAFRYESHYQATEEAERFVGGLRTTDVLRESHVCVPTIAAGAKIYFRSFELAGRRVGIVVWFGSIMYSSSSLGSPPNCFQ